MYYLGNSYFLFILPETACHSVIKSDALFVTKKWLQEIGFLEIAGRQEFVLLG